MRLRHIVPTLGLIAAAGTAQAADIANGLTLGGFVDTTLEFVTNDGMTKKDDAKIQFNAMAELQVGYAIDENVALQIDLEFQDSNSNLEQAYIAYGVNEQVTLKMGKFEGLIGYEGWDAPSLYRVNQSPVFGLNGIVVTGLDVNVAATEQITADFYLANAVLEDNQSTTDALGLGASVTYTEETFLVDLDIAFDQSNDQTKADNSTMGINLSGEYTGMEKLTAFGDVASRTYDAGSILGIMVGANYQVHEQASATVMVTMIEDDDDIDGTVYNQAAEMEVAVALLTTPIQGNDNFAVNAELQFLTPEADGAEDQVGFYLEFLGIIP